MKAVKRWSAMSPIALEVVRSQSSPTRTSELHLNSQVVEIQSGAESGEPERPPYTPEIRKVSGTDPVGRTRALGSWL